MSCPFKFSFLWNPDDADSYILREYLRTELLDHDRKPIKGSSVAREEINCAGLEWFLNEPELAPGRYMAEGRVHYSRDYYGESDMEVDVEIRRLPDR